MIRKESFDDPCIFMCCTLLSRFAALPCVCVHVLCICMCLHHSPIISQRSFPMSQLYHCLCLHPPFITNPLATCLYCQTVLLPCSVFPLKVFRCITPPHASRNSKVTHLTRSSVRQRCHLIYSHTHPCVVSGTCSSGLKKKAC